MPTDELLMVKETPQHTVFDIPDVYNIATNLFYTTNIPSFTHGVSLEHQTLLVRFMVVDIRRER